MRCLIIDDEPLAIQLLSAYVERSPDLEVAGTFSDPIAALHFLTETPVDLLFLDVQMPELTGIQLLKIVRGAHDVVLTTAYEEYALAGYEFDVADYLLKPISLDRFLLAVDRVKNRRATANPAPAPAAPPPPALDYLFVKSGHRTVRVDMAYLIRLESMSNYVALHTPTEKILTLENLSHYESVLPAADFVRIHRSHIVALAKIDFIERNRVVVGGDYLPISEGYREGFWERVRAGGGE